MDNCRFWTSRIPEVFSQADREITAAAITSQNYEELSPNTPDHFIEHLRRCSDCPNDVLWFLEIREECDVSTFPCLHLAYASSGKANHLVTRDHGVFALTTAPRTGIVIGYCPWCGIELPVAGG